MNERNSNDTGSGNSTPPAGAPAPQAPPGNTGEIEVTKAQLEEALAKLRAKDEELAAERVCSHCIEHITEIPILKLFCFGESNTTNCLIGEC